MKKSISLAKMKMNEEDIASIGKKYTGHKA